MKKNLTALALAAGFAVLLPHNPAHGAAQDCTDRVLSTCTTCHYQTRICEKLDKKSKREWQATIKLMLRYGLVLDETGQASVLDCLVALKADHAKLCK